MRLLIREPCIFILPVFSLLSVVSVELLAQTPYPSCEPMKSDWDNIERVTELNTEEGEIVLTVSMQENLLWHYYGFAFVNNDRRTLPTEKERTQFHQYFSHKVLVALQEKPVNKDGDRLYGFKPVGQGHWMIYLIASLDRIDFLEHRQLQIQPNIEFVRGGTPFTGSSFNLEETETIIDYKVCQIPD